VPARAARHGVDLACGIALALVAVIDVFTASSLSRVTYVQPQLAAVAQFLEMRLSQVNVACAAAVLLTWPFVFRHRHRRLILAVGALQTVGLVLDVTSLVASTVLGERANPLYLLLEAACVHVSVVLIFAVWYTALDHPGQLERAAGGGARALLVFAQNNVTYPGYQGWTPGFADYLFVSFCMSNTLGPGDAVPLARPLKLLMMLQVSLALLVLVVLASRAIGLIR
jgi:hypothetical protein